MIAFPWSPQYYLSEYKSGYRLHKNGIQLCEPPTESLGCSYIMWREWGPEQTPEGRQTVNALVQKAMHQQKYAGSDWSDMTWVMSGHPHGCHKRTDHSKIRLRLPFVRRYMSLMVSVASALKGSPLSPPDSFFSSHCNTEERDIVVLLMIKPSTCSWKRKQACNKTVTSVFH